MKSRSLLLLVVFACSAPAFAQDACTPVLAILGGTQNAQCVHSDDLMTRNQTTTPQDNSVRGLPPFAFTPRTDAVAVSPHPPARTAHPVHAHGSPRLISSLPITRS